ncbi:hypothetical protein V8G54_021294 [Vigna mungo]|uniref:C2H2-type domain-containing protein n=1 Tax=Vigna mungo TaxID=3915 RepID=A0AAQ3NFV4_VIGMU
MPNSNSNPKADPTLQFNTQDPNITANPQLPLQNLSQVRTRIDSLQHFLSQSISTSTPLTTDQIAMVSTHIISSIHQIIVNGAALVTYSQHATAAVTPDASSYPKPEPSATDKHKQLLDSELEPPEDGDGVKDDDCEIVELDAVELLAEHIHFCEICGKGFRRDANLRMHMRAHGDQFKTPEALARPSETGAAKRAMQLQPEQATPAVSAAEVGGVLEEPLQAQPLSKDVLVHPVPQEALLGAFGFEKPREALRRVQVEVHVRDHVLEEGQVGHAPALACDEEDKGKQAAEDDDENPILKTDGVFELGNCFGDEELPEGFFDDFGSIDDYCLEEVLGFPKFDLYEELAETMLVSLEALAMAGASDVEFGMDIEEWEKKDLEQYPPSHLLATEEEKDEEKNRVRRLKKGHVYGFPTTHLLRNHNACEYEKEEEHGVVTFTNIQQMLDRTMEAVWSQWSGSMKIMARTLQTLTMIIGSCIT